MLNLSLKGVLLHALNRLLSSNHEACASSFIEFLRNEGFPIFDKNLSKPVFSGKQNDFRADNKKHNKTPIWQDIPLQKKKNSRSILYISALPQILSREVNLSHHFSPIVFSQRVCDWLNNVQFDESTCEPDHNNFDFTLLRQLWTEFEVETQRPGWIAFCLSANGIAQWLNHAQHFSQADHLASQLFLNQNFLTDSNCSLLNQPNHHPVETDIELQDLMNDNLWQIEYTYARCCSLLQQWHGIPGTSPTPFQVSHRGDTRTAVNFLSMVSQPGLLNMEPSFQTMLHALIETADDMFWIPYRWPKQQYFLLLKRGNQLCQAFELFYRHSLCGFHQPMSTQSKDIFLRFQARFGLVSATRNRLNVLLRSCLGEQAPRRL